MHNNTIKRITISLTKQDVQLLDQLQKLFGEKYTQIIKRAIQDLHHKEIK